MQLTEKQESMIKEKPLEVAMTLPPTWDYADSYLFLNDEMQAFLDGWIESRDESIRGITRKRVFKDPTYFYKILKAQEKALEYAIANNLVHKDFEPQCSSMGKSIILWAIDQGAGTCDAATEVAEAYGMISYGDQYKDGYPVGKGESLRWAQHVHDCVAQKECGDYILRMYGDDRGWGEGAYTLTLTYNNAEVDRVFDLELCGVA